MRYFGDKFFPALSMPNKIKLITSCATELIKLAKMTDGQANLDCKKDMLNTCQNDKNYLRNYTLCSLKQPKVNLFFLFHLSIFFLNHFYLFINLSFVFQFLFNIQIQFYTIFSAQHVPLPYFISLP